MPFGPVKLTSIKAGNTAVSLTTSGITTVTGDLVIVLLSCFGNHIGATPVTDSLSNTWTAAIASTGTTKGWGAMFYSTLTTGGAAHTFTFTPTATDFIAMAAIAVQGAATSSVLGNTATSTASGTTHTAGAISANAVVPELLVGGGALSAAAEGTPSVADGRWLDASQAPGATAQGIVVAWRLVDPSTSDSFTYTTGSAQNETVMIAGFKSATGGAINRSLLAAGLSSLG